jgi:predicted dehydrogenase
MLRAASDNHVKLMIAYRLHFEAANLKAVEIVESGKLGNPRIFSSIFTMQVKEGNIRLKRDLGGGTLYDIGIYCINASRYLYRDEPLEVFAFSTSGPDKRFEEVDEMTSAILRFPNQRLAAFTCSFGAADASCYQIVGTKGSLRVDPAYEFAEPLVHHLTLEGINREHTFPRRDQFGPQLVYFSDCIQTDKNPEPSGKEGLIDVHIIRSLYRSAETGEPVKLRSFGAEPKPEPDQRIDQPPVREPELVHAERPSE